MAPETMDEYEVIGGALACHRKPPVLLPGALGKLSVIHQPCLREKCTLWNNAFGCCSDVNNAVELTSIRQKLQVLIDHLPPELP